MLAKDDGMPSFSLRMVCTAVVHVINTADLLTEGQRPMTRLRPLIHARCMNTGTSISSLR